MNMYIDMNSQFYEVICIIFCGYSATPIFGNPHMSPAPRPSNQYLQALFKNNKIMYALTCFAPVK